MLCSQVSSAWGILSLQMRHAAVILEQEHVRRGRSADKPDPNHVRWRLDSEYKEDICSRLPLDEDVPLRQHLNL